MRRPPPAALLTAGCLVARVFPALSQGLAPEATEEVKQLVAMVECNGEAAASVGAGIIVGQRLDTLYIATADHVVRACRTSGNVRVLLRDQPAVDTRAQVAAERDTALDLALLKVSDSRIRSMQLPFDRLGDPNSVAVKDYVYSLGWRNEPWSLSTAFDPVAKKTADRIFFESSVIGPGHSGGALLTRELMIIGMLRSDQPPYGEAISITDVLNRVKEWDYPVQLTRPSVPQSLQAFAVGATHMCGLDARGSAYCWGGQGQYGTAATGSGAIGPTGRRVVGGLRFRSIAAGDEVTCGVTHEDLAYCWGSMISASRSSSTRVVAPTQVASDYRFRTLSIGGAHICGIAVDGAAFCWGTNELGQLGDGTKRNSRTPVHVATDIKFATISAGNTHTCALTVDGAAYCWGQNIDGEAGIGSNEMVRSPAPVAGDLRFRSVSASQGSHVCAVTGEGDAYCWGNNSSGQIGAGDAGESHFTPSAVAGEHKFMAIQTGWGYSCGIAVSGEVYCWGLNEDGQLGIGEEADQMVPTPIAGGLRFSSLDVAKFYGKLTCGMTTDGTLYCWGRTETPSLVGTEFPIDVAVPTPTRVRP